MARVIARQLVTSRATRDIACHRMAPLYRMVSLSHVFSLSVERYLMVQRVISW